jgi:hypothetical protein
MPGFSVHSNASALPSRYNPYRAFTMSEDLLTGWIGFLSPPTPPQVGQPRRVACTTTQSQTRRELSVSALLRSTRPRGGFQSIPPSSQTGSSTGNMPSDHDSAQAQGEHEEKGLVPDTLSADVARAVEGKGKEGCEQCVGVGSIACPVCSGKGFSTISMMETVSAAQCRLCRGKCAIPCPTCREFIYKSVVWWDEIPSEEEDPDQNWRTGPDGNPRIPWSPPPV